MNDKLKNFFKKIQLKQKIKKNNTLLNLRTLASEDIQNEYSPEELENFFAKQDSLSAILDSLENIDAKPDTTDNLQAWDMHNIIDERDRPGVEYASKNIETKNSKLMGDDYDETQLGLTLAGMTPGVGAGADIAALIHSLKNKEGGDSFFNLLSLIPGLGIMAGGIKNLKKSKKLSRKNKRVIDADETELKAMQDYYRDSGLRTQNRWAELTIKQLMKTMKRELKK